MIEIVTSNIELEVGKAHDGIHKQTGEDVKMFILGKATREEYMESDVEIKTPLEYFYKVSFD